MKSAVEPDDPGYGDTSHCGAALHTPVEESTAGPGDPEYGDAAHCGTALHRPVASPSKEAAEHETLLFTNRFDWS